MTRIRDGRTVLKDIAACRERLYLLELELARLDGVSGQVDTNEWQSRKLDSYGTGFVLSVET